MAVKIWVILMLYDQSEIMEEILQSINI